MEPVQGRALFLEVLKLRIPPLAR